MVSASGWAGPDACGNQARRTGSAPAGSARRSRRPATGLLARFHVLGSATLESRTPKQRAVAGRGKTRPSSTVRFGRPAWVVRPGIGAAGRDGRTSEIRLFRSWTVRDAISNPRDNPGLLEECRSQQHRLAIAELQVRRPAQRRPLLEPNGHQDRAQKDDGAQEYKEVSLVLPRAEENPEKSEAQWEDPREEGRNARTADVAHRRPDGPAWRGPPGVPIPVWAQKPDLRLASSKSVTDASGGQCRGRP